LHGAERHLPVLELASETSAQKVASACESQRGKVLEVRNISVKERDSFLLKIEVGKS